MDLVDGDRLLLCTDGLNNELRDDAIAEVLINQKDIDLACKILIDKANWSGGNDNITVLIIDYKNGGIDSLKVTQFLINSDIGGSLKQVC